MNPTFKLPLRLVAVAVGLTCGVSAKAVTFETENISGNFDSTISLGLGVRASTPTCGLVLQGATGPGAPTGCLDPISGLGDQGNLNYARGDLFAGQLKGSHECGMVELARAVRGTGLHELRRAGRLRQ